MRICKRCIQPDSRPNIFFDDNGICGACIWQDEKKKIDWESREKELQDVANWAKINSKGNYDCAIGVSGGKDSTFQALTARDRLGLRCLLVNSEPDDITDIGKHNLENLKKLGFDVISLRPNPKIMKKLIEYDFYKHGNPVKITEFSLWSSTYIIAEKFDIPLIIQGENPALSLGVSKGGMGKGSDALEANKQNTQALGLKEYLDIDGVEEKDLFMFQYDGEKLRKKGIRGVWLGYFLKEWSMNHNAEFGKKHGLKYRPKDFDPASIGSYAAYAQLDVEMVQVSQLLKYIKFGFGQCMDYACYDFREGRITKDEAIDLVRKYDGKLDDYFIKKFCDSIDISMDEFWRVANTFRGPMWTKNNDGIWHNTYWDVLDNIT